MSLANLKDIWPKGTEWGIQGDTGSSQLHACMGLLPPECPDSCPSCHFQNSCCPQALLECLITWHKHWELQLPPWATSRATRQHHSCHLQGGSFLVPTQFVSCWSPSPGLGALLEPTKHAAHQIWTCTTTNAGFLSLRGKGNSSHFIFRVQQQPAPRKTEVEIFF